MRAWTRSAFLAALAAASFHIASHFVAGAEWLAIAAKPVPVLCLTALALGAGRDAYAVLVAVGLALSSLGDLLLALPGDLFVHGLLAFLAAHLAYTAAFIADVARLQLLRAAPFALFGLGVFALIAPGLGPLAAPVAVYVAVLCSMMWRAAARLGASRRGPRSERAAVAGAVLFAGSDWLLAVDRFLEPLPLRVLLVMVPYWAGQLGIALSVRVTPGRGAPAARP